MLKIKKNYQFELPGRLLKKPPTQGFTLVEILIVMTVMAILMGIALVSFQGSRAVARDSQRKTELEEIRSALEVYRTDNSQYILPAGNPSNWYAEIALDELVDGNYLSAVPRDPLEPTYRYRYNTPDPDSAVTYVLCAFLETGGSAVSGCGGECGSGVSCNYRVANP